MDTDTLFKKIIIRCSIDDAGTFFQIGRELLTNLQHWSCQFYHLKLVMESVKLFTDSKTNFGLPVLRWLNGLNKTLIIFFSNFGAKIVNNMKKNLSIWMQPIFRFRFRFRLPIIIISKMPTHFSMQIH